MTTLAEWMAADVTGAKAAAIIAAFAGLALVAFFLKFAGDADDMDNRATVAFSRFARLADLTQGRITSGTVAKLGNVKRLADDSSPFLGGLRDPYDKNAPPLDLRYRGEKHLLSFGCPGSSKSTSLAAVNLMLLRRSMVVIDPKGQLYAITANKRRRMGSKVILINPFGELLDVRNDMQSDGWNPLLQLDPGSFEFQSKAKTLAEAVADMSGNPKSDFFEQSMTTLWAAFCMYERLTKGDKASLRNVRQTMATPELMRAALEEMRTNDDYYGMQISASATHGRLTDKSGQSTSLLDVISTTLKNTDFLDDDRLGADMAAGNAIDFKAMHHELTTVYLVVPVAQLDRQRKYLRMFVNLAIESFFDDAPRSATLPRVMIILDEMGNLGRLPQVLRALTALRDYHVQLFMFFQELGQVKAAYPNEWTQFFTGSGVLSSLTIGTGDTTTAEHLSKTCGKREAKMTSNNVTANGNARAGAGTTTATQVFDLIPPEEFYRLQRGEAINHIEPCPWPIRGKAFGYWELFEPSDYDDNPYYRR